MVLAPEDIAFMNTRCDVVVGSASAAGVPSMCWGMGGHVSAQGRRVTVWLSRAQSHAVVADVRATGRIAATFCEPFTSRSRQLKGADAQVRDARQADAPTLTAHLRNMEREIGRVGFCAAFTHAAFHQPLTALVAIEFTPADHFEQTPGPQAGREIEASPDGP